MAESSAPGSLSDKKLNPNHVNTLTANSPINFLDMSHENTNTTDRTFATSYESAADNIIPVRITSRKRQHVRAMLYKGSRVLRSVQVNKASPSLPSLIPRCLVLNARSIVKPDALPALYADLTCNNIDVCCISETWLKPAVPNSLVCPVGFSIIRKDRINCRGGGVAIICRNDWKMQTLPNLDNPFECLWTKIVTQNSDYYVATIYHPPDNDYDDRDLTDFLIDSCEQLLSAKPNSKIIIAGDINKLNIRNLLDQLSFAQLVKVPTRGQNILDVFITNAPHYWKKVKVVKSLVRSDHDMVITYPRDIAKAKRTNSYFRDVRQHKKLNMLRELETLDWNMITADGQTPDEMIKKFYEMIWPIFQKCFPLIKVRTSSRDPLFMSPIVKHLLKQRKKAIRNSDTESNVRLQEQINKLIRDNQLNAVKHEMNNQKAGTKRWWSNVNSITSRKSRDVSVSALIDPCEINVYFQGINTDPNYVAPKLLQIPEGTRIPSLSIYAIQDLLLNQKRSASGPDDLPYWFWKKFAAELAPVITEIFNTSLRVGKVPMVWKLANVLPLPKEAPLNSCNQLRPISLTDIIMRLFERSVYKTELAPVIRRVIGSDQFAYKEGHNSTMALIKCQHAWLKWLDSDAKYVRVLSFDFSKAFDSVPHDILCEKIKKLPINPYVVNWIISFLEDRKQRVVVDGIVTEYLKINRGVPQGTVLGPVLFSIMVNDIKIVDSTNQLVKFADDLTLEVPGNESGDTSQAEVNSIQVWSEKNRMPLNMKKSYEMVVRGNTFVPLPDPFPSIERKTWLKILGVTLQDNPCKWDLHFEEMLRKASRRMYIMRVCKYYGLPIKQLDILFNSLIMSIFTYAIELWGCAFYSKYINQIDKFINRAYRNGYISKKLNIMEISNKRDKKLWNKITLNEDNALQELLPEKRSRFLRPRGHDFELPLVRTERYKSSFINRCLFNFV